MGKRVLVVLADGFEEIEAVTPVDVLRRAGCQVTTAGLEALEVTGSRGIKVVADTVFSSEMPLADAVVLPGGGPGSKKLGGSAVLRDYLKKMDASGKWIAAICAAPAVVLAPAGVLDGKKATCFPGCEEDLGPRVVFSAERVVRDGNVVTSRGPGTALEFALELVTVLAGPEEAARLAGQMVFKRS